MGCADAGGGKGIKMRRFQVVINPCRSDVGPAVVIGIDEDDVGLLCRKGENEGDEERGEFHEATCARTSV